MYRYSFIYLMTFFTFAAASFSAQVSYNAAAAYGTRKIIPAYTGKALQVRRSCDNAVKDIGFTSCGNLDTTELKAFVLAANPLSQMSSSAAAVYSLRKMSCSYNGPAIRVRSSAAGSPTTDIGFTAAGDLDTAVLKTFAGANSAFVTTWYDQSANAFDAVQSTNNAQPRIVNAGVVDRRNGKPALFFDGLNTVLLNSAYSMLVDNQTPTWNAVVVPISPNDVYSAIVCWRYAGGIESALEFGPGGNWNTSWWSNTNYNLTNGSSVVYNAFQILTSLYNATSNQLYINGSLSYNNTGQSNTAAISTNPNGCAATGLRIGNDNCCGGRFVRGYIIEIVLSPTNLSNTDRQFLEWSQGQYYGVSGPALATLPASPASASVTAWYDQSGSSKDAVQATAANQPRIINAGTIEKNGTVPALSFAGFPQNLVAPLSTSLYPVSVSVLGNTSGNSSGGAFFKLGTSVNAGQAGIAIGIGNSGGTFDNAGTSVIGLKEWVVWSPSSPNVSYPANPFTSTTIQQAGGGGMSTFLNGTNVPLSNASNAVGASIAGNLFIGGYTNSANRYATVKESEIIVFPSALSATRRNLLETQQAAYNNVSIAASKYTPPTANSYVYYVNGVGRESATDSVSGTRQTVGLGFSIGQTASDFLKDNGDYITSGVNCPLTGTTVLDVPGGIVQRWNNDWYIVITDVGANGGNLNIFFDFGDYGMSGLPGTAANYELLYRNASSGAFAIVPGTTKSVLGDRVIFTTAVPPGGSAPYYITIGTGNPGVSPLPVELLKVDLSCDTSVVALLWTTATEHSNDYFSIERSADALDYTLMGTVKGSGDSHVNKSYSYFDRSPLTGISYYRISQTDFDGQKKSYQLFHVNCESSIQEIKIYPNPNKGAFTLESPALYNQMSIFNAMGQVVFTEQLLSERQQIELRGLEQGIYFLRLENGSQFKMSKIVIQY